MFAAGALLTTLGYALLWTGVQRFRGDDVTLLEALGLSSSGQTNRVGGDANSNYNTQGLLNQLAGGIPANPTASYQLPTTKTSPDQANTPGVTPTR